METSDLQGSWDKSAGNMAQSGGMEGTLSNIRIFVQYQPDSPRFISLVTCGTS